MIYKLTYTDKAQAVKDLESKGILIQTEDGTIYGEGVQAVVEIGVICLDSIAEPPVYADGYHYDIMADNTYDFGANLVEPKNSKHAFAGHAVTEEMIIFTEGI